MKAKIFVSTILTIGMLLFAFIWASYEKPENKVVAEAMWASSAKTVPEVSEKADVIVRVKVESVDPTRLLTQELPISSKPQDDYSDEPVWSGETEEISMPFIDTNFKILQVYKGDKKPGDLLTVTQTGGYLPAQDNRAEHFLEFSEDPVYKPDEEYILFLSDISGDEIHAPNRELYLVMTPFARYRINKDGTVRNYSLLESSQHTQERHVEGLSLPFNIEDLEKQIEVAQENNP